MKVAVYGTSLSREFVPVLEEFFQFLRTNNIEVQLFKPFYTFLVEEINATPYYSSFFHSYADFDEKNNFIFSVGGMGHFFILY